MMLKTLTSFLVLAALGFNVLAQAQTSPTEIVLPSSTAINVHLTKAVSSKTAQRGDVVDFVVDEDIVVDGHTVIKKDTVAQATVIYSEKSGYLGHSGKLAIQVDSTKTVDGKAVPLRAAKGGEGDSAAGATIALTMLAGPFGMLKKGGDTVIPEGTKLTVYTAEERRFSVNGTEISTLETPAPATDGEPATVYFYRPKKFVGGALEPSVFADGTELARMDNGRYFMIKLSPGKHLIHLTSEKKGYELNMAAGQTYYFRIGIEAGMWKGGGKIILEANDKAAGEIKKIKYLGTDKIKDAKMVLPAPTSAS